MSLFYIPSNSVTNSADGNSRAVIMTAHSYTKYILMYGIMRHLHIFNMVYLTQPLPFKSSLRILSSTIRIKYPPSPHYQNSHNKNRNAAQTYLETWLSYNNVFVKHIFNFLLRMAAGIRLITHSLGFFFFLISFH